MPILPKLIGLYEDSGFTISTGLMPSFFDGFTGSEEAIAAMNHELWKRKNKRKIKFQRSLDKRKSALKKLFGKGG
ncbi:MAG: hypothetical protein OQJ87_08215 [Rhodospirillales bacterium]|nr:hypothetical protein [Rhodospirillales bacterium]